MIQTRATLRPSSPPRAVIFDMDGVLLDSEPLHHQAVNHILASESNEPLTVRDYVPFMGTTDEYTWSDLIRRFGLSRTVESYCKQYDRTVLDLYRSHSQISPGAAELVNEIRARGLALAVASSSRREWVETCLTALGIREAFDLVITGDMVERGKPDPEIYLLTARCLGVPPESCVAIEDSPNGVASAIAAGMFTTAVASSYPTDRETGGAHVHIACLTDFDCSILPSWTGTASLPSEMRST